MRKYVFTLFATVSAFCMTAVHAQQAHDQLYTQRGTYGVDKYESNVLCVNGKPFMGSREQALAYQKAPVAQPEDTNLLLTEWVFQKKDSMELSQGPIIITLFIKRADGYWEEVTEFANVVPHVTANKDRSELYIMEPSRYRNGVEGFPVMGVYKSTWTRSIATYHVYGGNDQTMAEWGPRYQ